VPGEREWVDRRAGRELCGLRTALDRQRYVQPGVRSWVLTSLAEMAARAGMAEDAQRHFREALALDAADNYLLGAYADFLLDHGHPEEVIALLQDKTRADPLGMARSCGEPPDFGPHPVLDMESAARQSQSGARHGAGRCRRRESACPISRRCPA
jgi:hypothetical protein